MINAKSIPKISNVFFLGKNVRGCPKDGEGWGRMGGGSGSINPIQFSINYYKNYDKAILSIFNKSNFSNF